jgi:hypothetical protein
MKTENTKKSKEIEKEIKVKLIASIEGVLTKSDKESSEKIQKSIQNASSKIAKKFVRAVKKSEKKALKVKEKAEKKVKPAKVSTSSKKVSKVKLA